MSDGLKSFMSEPVSLKRWKIYVLTFGFSAFGIMAIIGLLDLSLRAALAATFKASLFALGVLVMSHWASWPKRVRNVLAFALIGIALLLLIAVWHGGTASEYTFASLGLLMIPDGYTHLAPGKIAAVVTYLEMLERSADASDSSVRLKKVENPDLNWYREIFRRAGEQWLWWSRLEMDDPQLSGVLNAPTTELFIAESDQGEIGMAELDRAKPGEVEIAFFGLFAEALGKGLGRPFMMALLDRAWDRSTSRVWVHTCTLDNPAALPFYIKCGFTSYKRAIEVADDPRLRGILPESAAPQVPIIR